MVFYAGHSRGRAGLFPRGFYGRVGKRALDVAMVLVFLPIWLGLAVVLWGVAWIEAGSGLYVDNRVGRHGRPFRCLKIRSMQPNIPRSCAVYKQADDPRITPFGRFIRRTSLDEVPQLWCVLKGEMSLVGPRPVPAFELNRYGAQRVAYLQLRPGLTGLWQVSGRNACTYEKRISLDVKYSREVSLWLDLKILCATVIEIFRMSGR